MSILSLIIAATLVGSPLPAWSEGCLDIHAINSARGECTFFILPDGTTMLVDAGDVSSLHPKYQKVAPKPDSATAPAEVYARYIRHFLPKKAKGAIDYAVVSHGHIDHDGAMAALEASIPFRKRLTPDGSWSAAGDEATPGKDGAAKQDRGAGPDSAGEAFQPGSGRQISLQHRPGRYRNFRIMNYAADGKVWDGEKLADPYKGKQPRGNARSCCFLLSYGAFDYYSGGDAGDNTRVALPVARAIGRPIEAMKADHHLSHHTMKKERMDILRPQVIVTQSFFIRDIQPDLATLKDILEWSPETRLYFTNIAEQMQVNSPEIYSKAAGMNGHIVIRVLPGGKEYMVYMLDDSDFSYRVLSAGGPFPCYKE